MNAAIEQIQSEYPGKFVYCFGEAADGWDIAVYESEADFDLDAEEGTNDRMIARVSVNA